MKPFINESSMKHLSTLEVALFLSTTRTIIHRLLVEKGKQNFILRLIIFVIIIKGRIDNINVKNLNCSVKRKLF